MICRNSVRLIGALGGRALCAVMALACIGTLGADSKPLVLTTFLPAYSLTATVAGTAAVVENLAPGKVGVHEFDLAPRDVRRLAKADVIVLNGLGVESWMERSLDASGARKRAQLVELASAIPPQELIGSRSGEGETHETGETKHEGHRHGGTFNPHVWLDPTYMANAVSNIVGALERANPSAGATYRSNGAALTRRLLELDRELSETAKTIRSAPFVTLHDAYPYLVRRYQLRQVGVVREVPDVDPSPRHIGELMKLMRDASVKVVFTEPNTPVRATRQLALDTGTRVAVLDTLEAGELGADAYEQGLRRILQTLKKELGAP